MTTGLKIWNADGSKQLDMADFTTRLAFVVVNPGAGLKYDTRVKVGMIAVPVMPASAPSHLSEFMPQIAIGDGFYNVVPLNQNWCSYPAAIYFMVRV